MTLDRGCDSAPQEGVGPGLSLVLVGPVAGALTLIEGVHNRVLGALTALLLRRAVQGAALPRSEKLWNQP